MGRSYKATPEKRMRVGECCNRAVITATGETGIQEAAQLMREHQVGTLVIVSGENGARHPLGIVTDRDLVVEVLAQKTPRQELTLGDIMSSDLLTAGVDDGLWETLERMSARGVRRLPVVTRDNVLEGILSVDDVVQVLVDAQSRMVRLVRRERQVQPALRSALKNASPKAAPFEVPARATGPTRGPVAEWMCGDGFERRVAQFTSSAASPLQLEPVWR